MSSRPHCPESSGLPQSPLNRQARLEVQTKTTGFSILVSGDTAARATAEIVSAGDVEIRGLESSIGTFTVAESR